MRTSASVLVEEAKVGEVGLVGIGIVNTELVSRAVNRFRQDMRPDEPKDMSFEV